MVTATSPSMPEFKSENNDKGSNLDATVVELDVSATEPAGGNSLEARLEMIPDSNDSDSMTVGFQKYLRNAESVANQARNQEENDGTLNSEKSRSSRGRFGLRQDTR